MHHAASRKKKFTLAAILSVGMLSLLSFLLFNTRPASASIPNWNPGYIISDYVFTNKGTMNTGDIQAFLNSKVPDCDTYGEETSEFGGGTRRQWAEARGYNPPYTCLRDFSENGKSAAQIIYEAAQRYSINPQVLLVLLQKEQGLVQDEWPINIQYRSATGYGCPDTAACDSEYYGFTNQVRWAATMFRAILNDSPTWYTPYEVGNNYIQYNPNSSCGGSTVNIQNRATQALYNYTPYQPNQAALNAANISSGAATVDCGAYGNLNFYIYFTRWFGSTTTNRMFTSLKDPRWMQLKNNTRKVDPLTGSRIEDTIPAGRQIRFTSKTTYTVNGYECLRTEYDTARNARKCILRSDIEELSLIPEPITETLMRTTANTFKRDLRRGTIVRGSSLPETKQVTVSAQITVGGTTYYISKHDLDNNLDFGMLSTRLSSSTSAYSSISSTELKLSESTAKVIPVNNDAIDSTLPVGLQRAYTSRTFANGQWYYRTNYDTIRNFDKAIPESKLDEIDYVAFELPRWMKVTQNTQKVAPLSDGTTSENLSNGQQIKFSSKVWIGGKWYYRTAHDTTLDTDKAVPASYVKDIYYEAFTYPRKLKLSAAASKYVPSQEQVSGSSFPQGMERIFSSKIYINGQWYYRTETDARNHLNTAFRATDLEEVE